MWALASGPLAQALFLLSACGGELWTSVGCARVDGDWAWECDGREAPTGRTGPRCLQSVSCDSRELESRGGEKGMWNKESSWVRAVSAKVRLGVGRALMWESGHPDFLMGVL